MNEGLVARELDYVLVRVRPEPLSLGLSLMQAVIEEGGRSGATVGEIVSTLVVLYFGLVTTEPEAGNLRRCLVARLTEHYSEHIAVVHGSAVWPVGMIGSTERMAFGPISNELTELLGEALRLPLGEVLER